MVVEGGRKGGGDTYDISLLGVLAGSLHPALGEQEEHGMSGSGVWCPSRIKEGSAGWRSGMSLRYGNSALSSVWSRTAPHRTTWHCTGLLTLTKLNCVATYWRYAPSLASIVPMRLSVPSLCFSYCIASRFESFGFFLVCFNLDMVSFRSFFVSILYPSPIPGFRSVQATDADIQEREAGGGGFHILRLVGAVRDCPRLQVRELLECIRRIWLGWVSCSLFPG